MVAQTDQMTQKEIFAFCKKLGYGVQYASLLSALAMVESGGDVWAMRYEPSFRWTISEAVRPVTCTKETELHLQKCSFGLCQVMGATARSLGFIGWLTELFRPALNLTYAEKFLTRVQKRIVFPGCFEETIDRFLDGEPADQALKDLISAYNAGVPTERNARYVKTVLAYMARTNPK